MPPASLSKHRLPFALHLPTGRMVSPTEADNGLKCDCICHVCRSRVVSKQGDERIWHFAHHGATDCSATAESAIHAMAKQLIVERQAVYLPARTLQRTIRGQKNVWSEIISAEVQKAGLFDLKDCIAEKTIFDASTAATFRRPDVMATAEDRALAIEIHNTHAVDFEKAEWLDQQRLSALEIDVADLALVPPNELLERLTERLFAASNGTRWFTHSGDTEGVISLDRQEANLRFAKSALEADLLAQLAVLEEKKRKRDAFREKIQETDQCTIGLGSGTLRIGVSAIRCTLKVYGSAPDHWFKRITTFARQHGGVFNDRYKTWEFYQNGDTQGLFKKLHQAAQESLFAAVRQTLPAISPPASQYENIAANPPKRYFDDPALQEEFDERVAIMEFDGHIEREHAEHATLISMQAARQQAGRGHSVQSSNSPVE